ncbi:acyl-CoA dehydrogenase family protein [Tsuneonella sp. YG55]|uniref:Acyl-CoA dehydrogenase family protein n=1 Tax=Tsuneonella litorea TaxID=2976475 RepID=A0A9X2W0Z6_9SPHN|nr:acyl-CoA dehydrogenase family protein [Tsuneonella litorea]MCT2558801.1 acyl-CoA dehydrogenase family protein [Tsuneonella litorea]
MSAFLSPFEAMLDKLFLPARVRAIDAGGDWSPERVEIEQSGFLDALAPDMALPFAEVAALWRAIGRRAAPLAIGKAMIGRSGRDPDTAQPVLLAAAISGAADRVLDMTTAYAGERSQFGKPIGRQQAVQQQLALMAEEVVAIRMAVQLAADCDWPTAERAALAKAVAAMHAPHVASTAHAVHGAIGISAEHDLQLYTRRLHAWRLEEGGETAWSIALGRALLASDENALDWIRNVLF